MKITKSTIKHLTEAQKEVLLTKALDKLHKSIKMMNINLQYMNNRIKQLRQLDTDINNNNPDNRQKSVNECVYINSDDYYKRAEHNSKKIDLIQFGLRRLTKQ